MYEFLTDAYWKSLLKNAGDERLPFCWRRTSGGLLAAVWTGNSGSRKRTVLVCHTDREGYVIKDSADLISKQIVIGEQPYVEKVEDKRRGAQVEVAYGLGENESRLPAKTLTEDEAAAAGLRLKPNRVAIRLANASTAELETLRRACASPWPAVVACHAFGALGKLGVGRDGDFIEAASVDNAAGVAVCTAVLSDVVRDGKPVNLTVLYTTGEESGFLGALSMGCEDGWIGAEADEDVLWLVVDGSDVRQSRLAGLGAWRSFRFGTSVHDARWDEVLPEEPGSAWRALSPMDVAAVRLEDRASIFEMSGALILYQAALAVRNRLLGETVRHMERPKGHVRVRAANLGATAVFHGGVCEASVLSHLEEIQNAAGVSRQAGDWRCGALALPMQNYRFEATGQLEPEITTVGVINSAYLIALEACRLHMDYWYAFKSAQGYRGPRGYGAIVKKGKIPKSRSDLIEMWVNRYRDRGPEARAGLDTWWAKRGPRSRRGIGLSSRQD
jgi:hypothetical protein